MGELSRLALATLLAIAMSVRGYRKRSLNKSGAILALIVGFISCAASITLGLTLIAFFLGSSRITKVGAAKKKKIEDGHQEGGTHQCKSLPMVASARRSLPSTGCSHAVRACTRNSRSTLVARSPIFRGCRRRTSAITPAATRIRGPPSSASSASASPILVTRPWKTVPPGTNGGVTWVGTGASLLGGLFIGLFFWLFGLALQPSAVRGDQIPPQWPLILLGAAAGVLGSLIDSLSWRDASVLWLVREEEARRREADGDDEAH